MPTHGKAKDEKREEVFSGVLRLNTRIIGLVLGLVFGLAVFIGTNWLVIKDGGPVGPHLALLSQFFIGYKVSFWGSVIGFGYGLAIGTLIGGLIGWINSLMARLRRDRDLY